MQKGFGIMFYFVFFYFFKTPQNSIVKAAL